MPRRSSLALLEAATDPASELAGCCVPLASAPVSAADATELAAAFKAIGDPVRLQLLSMIASNAVGEVCVCDLTPAFDLTGPTISHHLRVLREAGLIDCQRRGTWVYYWAVPRRLAALSALLDVRTSPQSTSPQSTSPQSTSPQSTSPQSTSPQSTSPQPTPDHSS